MDSSKSAWTVEHADCNVAVVRCEIPSQPYEQYFLLSFDQHHDNPHSKQDLERKHLQQAKERGAGVIYGGDTFCAMQGKYDPRRSLDGVREEHRKKDYLDALVRTAADFYGPFAHNFICFGRGNHEESVRENNGVDLIERLVGTLNDRHKCNIQAGGYAGWVRFLFNYASVRMSRKLFYFHGAGGGGPITKDMIGLSRIKMYLSNADIIATGHTHDKWVQEDIRLHLTDGNKIEHRKIIAVKCGTYKEEYGKGYDGWHVGKGRGPKPIGPWWLKFRYTGNELRMSVEAADD